jgi:hypothetical protein
VQAPERLKDSFGIFRIETDAVIRDTDHTLVGIEFGRNADIRRFRSAILERILDEVLKELYEMRPPPDHDRQIARLDGRPGCTNILGQVRQGIVQRLIERHFRILARSGVEL